jgi:type IX secretion system PorP/SprF family membrane protein
MKRLLIILLFIGGMVKAQQLPQYSQFMFNQYAFNPAFAGSLPYYDVRSNNRYQWVGITDAPRTYTVSISGPSKNRKMGYGGFVYTDIVGPTRRIGAQASYAYHLNLNDNGDESIKLSFGLSAGILQWLVDGSKIRLKNPADAVISEGLQSSLVFDAKFGFYLYQNDRWHFGAAIPNLLGNKLYFFNYQTSALSRLERHFLIHGAYKFDIGDDFQVEPNLLIKYVTPAPLKVDASVRAIYKKAVWIGGSYRTNDAWSMMVGYNHKGSLEIGYSYDFTTTNLKNYSTGTHELMLGIKFTEGSVYKSKEKAMME